MAWRSAAIAAFLAALPWRLAGAAELSLAVEANALHTGMPFVLTLTAKGFDETPAPAAPDLAIGGCDSTYLGVNPNVSSRIQIINGRRSEWRDVAFVYRWRVLCAGAGRYMVPALSVTQGAVAAGSRAANFEVRDVPRSPDMVVRMRLPERALWVGETFEVVIEWLLARDVRDYRFAVPLFNLPDAQVRPPATREAATNVAFAAGASDVELPLQRTQTRENGRGYTQFAFPAAVTLNSSGVVDLPPIQVVARLQTGMLRDNFGFPRARHELFRALGERRVLTVRPLPQANRPAAFSGAIGSGFSIDVQASRTVVSVGDPIELAIRVRGDGMLAGLGLPPLGGPEALPPAHFTVPERSPPGVLEDDGRTKRFVVTARVKSAEVREIPPLAFAYFDPSAGEYRVARSQPIALAVEAAQLVGVGDVAAAPRPTDLATPGEPQAPAMNMTATLTGADLSQSAPGDTFARPWGTGSVAVWLGALYGVPPLFVLASFLLARTGGRRARARAVRHALATVERALASGVPAREAAPTVMAAMRRLASAAGREAGALAAATQALETQAFDPAAADSALPTTVIDDLRRIARDWANTARAASVGASA